MIEIIAAIIFATIGQVLMSHQDLRGLIPTALGVAILLTGLWRDERQVNATARHATVSATSDIGTSTTNQGRHRLEKTPALLTLAFTSAILAFLAAHSNTYRWYGVIAWTFAIGLFLIVFWERDHGRIRGRVLAIAHDRWRPSWTLAAVIGLILIGFLFRFWQLEQMPSEMTSDHVEKLLDVHDLDTGQRPVFFVRNTGREPWQFYWTLAFIRLFGLETKFFALKLGTAVVGLATLPGVFLLGRELFGRWVGLWATLFVAVASWPVILSRIGLRFPFAPAVTAWSLFFLLRGLRDVRRNDFILLGLSLGIGLHGYTAFRAMPLAVVVCWAIALLFRPRTLSVRPSHLLRYAALTIVIATVVFIPLGRVSLERPDDFWRRSASRLFDPNHPAPDGPFVTLVKNVKDLALMFNWQGDSVWVNTLANRPMLDPLLGGLLILGLVIALWRGLQDPIPLFLLLSGLILLLPSALSLAYPVENPSAARTGGAIPVVMVIAALPAGLAMDRGSKEHRIKQPWVPKSPGGIRGVGRAHWRAVLLVAGALTLTIAVTTINLRRYYVDYWGQYEQNAQNTIEIATAIRDFVESGGAPSNAWIIAWPYWIDTRGVGIELGDPPWNNVILEPEQLESQVHRDPEETVADSPADLPRFYVLHPQDAKTLDQLQRLFPHGQAKLLATKHPERNFVTFYVPSPRTLRESNEVGTDAP